MFKLGDKVKTIGHTSFGTVEVDKGAKGFVVEVKEDKYIRVLFPDTGYMGTLMHFELVPAKTSKIELEVQGRDLKLWDKIFAVKGAWGEVYGLEQNGKNVDVSIWIDNDIEYFTLGKKERVRIKR